MVCYVGHGIQAQGKNHLIPMDTRLNQPSDLRRTIPLNELLTEVGAARELGLVILTPVGITRSRGSKPNAES